MNTIYRMVFENIEDYIRLIIPTELNVLTRAIQFGELQYLDSKPLQINISSEGGFELPDYIYQDGFHFFSDRLKLFLDRNNNFHIFYKSVKVIGLPRNVTASYWLAIVPAIDCLDFDASQPKTTLWDCENGVYPVLEVKKIKIIDKALGNYHIFRIAGIDSSAIYLTSYIFAKLKNLHLAGITYINI